MSEGVCDTAMITCTGALVPAPIPLVATLSPTVMLTLPAATILDAAPMVNIATFGMCKMPTNPEVASATAAALGVLTPMPCVPMTEAWVPGAPTVLIGGIPALTSDSMCICDYGGEISIIDPGQVTVTITG